MALQTRSVPVGPPPRFGLGDARWRLRVFRDAQIALEQGGFFTAENALRRALAFVMQDAFDMQGGNAATAFSITLDKEGTHGAPQTEGIGGTD